jgi:ribosomal protein S18 acetylase RimI-like enzyme
MTPTLTIDLRPAVEGDAQFLRRVYAGTREDLALVDWTEAQRLAFLEMQFRAQDGQYRSQYANADFQVVLLDGEPAGRLYLDRTPARILVLDISLLPEHQGRGVGTALLTGIFEEARKADLSVVLSVETSNPAAALYRRLGFRPTSSGAGLYQEMTWSA